MDSEFDENEKIMESHEIMIKEKSNVQEIQSNRAIEINRRKGSQSDHSLSDDEDNSRIVRLKSEEEIPYAKNIEFLQELYVQNFKDHQKSFKLQEMCNKLKSSQ